MVEEFPSEKLAEFREELDKFTTKTMQDDNLPKEEKFIRVSSALISSVAGILTGYDPRMVKMVIREFVENQEICEGIYYSLFDDEVITNASKKKRFK